MLLVRLHVCRRTVKLPPILWTQFDSSMDMKVVIRVQLSKQKNRPEAQTKDRRPAIVWPYVSIMRRWAICLYWLAVGVELGHMFLLCGARPYVCIGWLWAWGSAICFYYAALGYMFLLVGCRRGAGPYVSIVCVYVYMCVCMCICMCVYICVCMCVCMCVCVCVCV